MDVMDAIKKFRAVRQYSSKKVPIGIIANILNAGRLSQSSRNSQPWRFLVIREKDILMQLSHLGNYASHLADCSFGIAILTPNPSKNVSILFDAGQAAVYLQLAAFHYGVGSCIVKMHEGHLAAELLKYPADHKLNFMIAFGYPADDMLFEPTKKTRKPLYEIAYLERWGIPFQS
jgi:nitroreductase